MNSAERYRKRIAESAACRSAFRQKLNRQRLQRREEVFANQPINQPPAIEHDGPFVTPAGLPLHLEGLYRGASVFVVLSGPSAAELNLSSLARRGVITFGVNNSPAVYRTNLWTSVDSPRKFHDAIWRDPAVMKFTPAPLAGFQLFRKTGDSFGSLTDDGRILAPANMPGAVLYRRNANFRPDNWLNEPTVNWGVSRSDGRRAGRPRTISVMFAVLKICFSLGFRRVFLLGADFNMTSDRPYSFATSKTAKAAASNNRMYGRIDAMLMELAPQFKAAGFEVFNCNPKSGLTAFRFLAYDSAIRLATDSVPQDPLDTVGWY